MCTNLNHSYLISPEPSTWQRNSTSTPGRTGEGNFGNSKTTRDSLIPGNRNKKYSLINLFVQLNIV